MAYTEKITPHNVHIISDSVYYIHYARGGQLFSTNTTLEPGTLVEARAVRELNRGTDPSADRNQGENRNLLD